MARPGRWLLGVLASVAACADDAPTATVRSFRFTAPGAAIEIVPVPTEALRVTWTADSDGAIAVELALVPTRPAGPAIPLGTAAIADGGLTWAVPAAAPRAGLYQLTATLRAEAVELAAVTASTIVILQGVEFRDPVLAFRGTDLDRDLWITATTASILDVEVYLATAATAPRQVLARASIASDLAPIGRVFTFTGQTVDGVAIAAGDHLGFIEARARDGAVTYRRDGLALRWEP